MDFTITRMYVDTPPNKTAYSTYHDVFDPAGMVVKIDYTYGSIAQTGQIITDYTYPTRELTTDDTNITLTCAINGQTASCTQAITVIPVDTVLNNNTWAFISQVAQDGNGDTFWDIGDRKAITLNGKIGDYLTLSNFTTYVFILDFNHPINKTTADNNIIFGGFKTALSGGVDICLVDSKYNYANTSGKYFNMNHVQVDTSVYNTNHGGWKGCDFRYDILGATQTAPNPYNTAKTTSTVGYDATMTAITSPVTNTLMAALPSDFRNVLRLHTHYVDNKGNNSNTDANVTSVIDAIFLLSEFEVFGTRSYANRYEQNHQKQMTYYTNENSKIRYKHNATSTAASQWESSVHYHYAYIFCYVSVRGQASSNNSQASLGVAPAFKV